MHRHRLDKLARLTQGVALVGLGTVASCKTHSIDNLNGPDPTPPHINAPAPPGSSSPGAGDGAPAAPPPSDAPTPSASATMRHTINAPPRLNTPLHVNAPPKL